MLRATMTKPQRRGTIAALQMLPIRYAFLLLAFAALQTRSLTPRDQGRLPSSSRSRSESSTRTRARSPDLMDRRQLLQRIVLSTATPLATTAVTASTATTVVLQPREASAASWIPETTKATTTFAKDKFGSVLVAKQYVASKPARDRSLVFGLKDEPTYLIVNADKTGLENFALNAECSHLGCVVPWNEFEQKFECPCHGSKYDATGNVLRGPAPYGLALAHVGTDEESGKILLSPWTEPDFRTQEAPWWN